jgi:hypothetical protein
MNILPTILHYPVHTFGRRDAVVLAPAVAVLAAEAAPPPAAAPAPTPPPPVDPNDPLRTSVRPMSAGGAPSAPPASPPDDETEPAEMGGWGCGAGAWCLSWAAWPSFGPFLILYI